MTGRSLDWFRLRFPTSLNEDALIAALAVFSGVSHQTRIVLDLTATEAGISHAVGVSARSTETLIASLRAAMPSLRLTADSEPEPSSGRTLLLQLSSRSATLRAASVSASSAALLSSLQPLNPGESVTLRWKLRPGPRPAAPPSLGAANDGHAKALRAKLAHPGLIVIGELSAAAGSRARRDQLIQRTAAVLRSLSSAFGRIVGEPPTVACLAWFLGRRGRYWSVNELAAIVGAPVGDGLDLPGLELGAARRVLPARALPERGRRLGHADSDATRPVAISPKASTTSLMVLGPTGTGKSSLLKNLIRSDLEQGRGLALIESNGDLSRELTDVIPERRINDVVLLSLTDPDYAVGFNPLASGAAPSLVADQLGELFERLWSAFWGPRTAQLMHMGLLTLAQTRNATLLDLPRLFVDEQYRASVLAGLDDPFGLEPDWRWFNSLSQGEAANVIAPMQNKVRAFTARESIRSILGQAKPALTMRQIVEQRKVLICHMPKGLVGNETARLFGCLVLTALWQALAERADMARRNAPCSISWLTRLRTSPAPASPGGSYWHRDASTASL